MSETKTKVHWNAAFSWLRSLACIAIIVLHVSSYSAVCAEALGYALSTAQRTGAALAQYSCMWAVPVFVMVTGALLLDPSRQMSWERLRKRYIGRVGKALLCFGLLFIVFDFAMNGIGETANNSQMFAAHPVALENPGVGTWLYVILCTVVDLLTGHSWPHMWYLFMLLGLYLLMPFFRKVVSNSSERELQYLIIVLFVFLSVLPLLGLVGIATDYRFSVATVYPLYLLLGYALQNKVIQVPSWAAAICLVLSTVAIWFAVYHLNAEPEKLSYFASYNSLLVVLQSTSIFDLLNKAAGEKSIPSALKQFDKCTFGIYLIHYMFVKLLLRYAAWNPYENVWMFPVILLLVLVTSFAVTYCFYRLFKRGVP